MLPQFFQTVLNVKGVVMSKWEEKFENIWSLFNSGDENRKMAYSLLDALVDVAKSVGQQHHFDKLFEGIEIQRDGLSLPKIIRDELAQIKVSRWNRRPLFTAIEKCSLIGIYELYFRMYPEKIQDLPQFLCLEGCDHVPSFCGPTSPVKALGLFPPFTNLKGIENFPNIERVHFYKTVPTFARFDGLIEFTRPNRFDTSVEAMTKGVKACIASSHVKHLFTFHQSISVDSIGYLETTNLESQNVNTTTLKYASKVQRRYSDPLMETVTTSIDGKKHFIVDSAKMTNSLLSDHPHLMVAADFLADIQVFLQSKTPYAALKQQFVDQNNVTHQTTFYLNDQVDDVIGDRILAIEVENDFTTVNRLYKETSLKNCTQLVFSSKVENWRYRGEIQLTLNHDLLQRWPRVEVLEHSFIGWSNKVKFTIEDDFWACEHPLRMVWNQQSNYSTGIGFKVEGGTFAERILAWQDHKASIARFKEQITPIMHLRILNGEALGDILPYIPNIQTLDPYPRDLQLPDVNKRLNTYPSIEQVMSFDEVFYYRPTVMTRIATLKDARRMLERKRLIQREVLNRKIPIGREFHATLIASLKENNPEAERLLNDWSEGKGSVLIGQYLYVLEHGRWKQRSHYRIDEQYVSQPRFNKDDINALVNLKLAFFNRSFDSDSLPKSTRVMLNTETVSMMDLQSCDWIRSLRIERPLSDEEWKALSQMKHLEILFIRNKWPHGEIEVLPQELYQMNQLQQLFLPNHDIASISNAILQMESLQVLSIRGNPITDPHELLVLLNQMPNLDSVYTPDLSGLTEIPELSFALH